MTHHTDAAGLDLARFLRPRDRIVWSQACGEPTTLVEALIAQSEAIGGLSAFAATSFSGVLDVAAAEKLDLSSMGAIGALRSLTAAHRLGIVPCHVSQVGPLIQQGLIGCDVAFVQVSPPNADGNHSFGLINDFMHAAVAKARVVIAEVNERVPFTHGDVVLPASRIDCAVHVTRTPVELMPAEIGDNDQAIARIVADYIDDEAVLQVGIGAVPDAILRLLHDRRDLGIHSGMLGDSFVDLVEAGVITNASKPFDVGVSVTTALIGTKRLYDFAHCNEQIGVRSSLYTHDAGVLSRLPNLVTINSAVEVDLTGQVNAEQSGSQYVGGTGGQTDFVRAGSRSPGGHAVVALPATAKGGKASRITVQLSGPVTTARNDVDVVVTEFGAAELKGQTLAERSRRMIAIAHPDFRAELERAAHTIRQRGF
ncbi:MAG TPA: acetyl-CoA hydrolase/transferase C-terminal domain-containing protein [Polyangiales bacterium]|nr:acetyl-CoA hydrolase/transferase C-terminal domain-containing protein [Polyangiales bacterium]